ncbi:hypothetical protein Nepgr_006987 [Nepenthes gracilis]|uniref:Uncharacterized protein n=1 Tax=Nepenthes gracilis TaxID=150966 RepID=A0AAD3S6V3_NEPGR|nr:hypothetical protein Nepgr_006987 [Nepenthes gracilis]
MIVVPSIGFTSTWNWTRLLGIDYHSALSDLDPLWSSLWSSFLPYLVLEMRKMIPTRDLKHGYSNLNTNLAIDILKGSSGDLLICVLRWRNQCPERAPERCGTAAELGDENKRLEGWRRRATHWLAKGEPSRSTAELSSPPAGQRVLRDMPKVLDKGRVSHAPRRNRKARENDMSA